MKIVQIYKNSRDFEKGIVDHELEFMSPEAYMVWFRANADKYSYMKILDY